MLNEKKKTKEDRRDKTEHPHWSSIDHCGITTNVGSRSPKYLLVDV